MTNYIILKCNMFPTFPAISVITDYSTHLLIPRILFHS